MEEESSRPLADFLANAVTGSHTVTQVNATFLAAACALDLVADVED
jgi:hypothetical protein